MKHIGLSGANDPFIAKHSSQRGSLSGSQASFERSAALFAPKPLAASIKGDDDMFGDEDEDMFAANPATDQPSDQPSDQAADGSKQRTENPVGGVAAVSSAVASEVEVGEGRGAGERSAAASTAVAGPEVASQQLHDRGSEAVDYSSWPIKELRRFLIERGQVTPSYTLALILR